MPSQPKPDIPKAAEPKYGQSFDPWNSSSTGHQRAENRLGGSVGWRDSRSAKLQSQFRGGATGGERMSDAVGAGSQDWDPEAKALIPLELRARAKHSVMDMLVKPGTMRRSMSSTSRGSTPASGTGGGSRDRLTEEERVETLRKAEDEAREAERGQPRKMFDGVVIYVNGSTHPLISDHKLKHVLAEHGARMSIHLGRRQVTHVILGRPAGGGGGAGGGLAGGKLQNEIQKVGGSGIKFVGVEWVLESIKAGKRLPEARFSNLKLASKRQQSVFAMTSKASNSKAPAIGDDEPPPSGQVS
ncbi:BRCA1 C terminus domain-containing protein [Xylariales sp. AK1849]|nr:BRCA1 C terminus domain-containing protein [Xylariales sp. AK1849]